VIKTLLVDGDNLFKIGFHGVRELFVEGNHIGGVFHFLNTLRRQLVDNDTIKSSYFGTESKTPSIDAKYILTTN